MIKNDSFLGVGWGFPPNFVKDAHSVTMVPGEVDIQESLNILFTTSLYERLMVPDYGCDLKAFMFKSDDNSFLNEVKDVISVAILHYEPRINLIDVTIDAGNIMDGQLYIQLEYVVRTTNSRNNVVYPFYLTQGNLIQPYKS